MIYLASAVGGMVSQNLWVAWFPLFVPLVGLVALGSKVWLIGLLVVGTQPRVSTRLIVVFPRRNYLC